MSFDFYPDEAARSMDRAAALPSLQPEPGIWAGTGTLIMQGLAKTARNVDLLGSVGPIVMDRLNGGTTEQDRYFKEHDEVFGRAVEYWAPEPGEVGTAGRIVGSILPKLAEVIISPGLAVGSEILGQGEDLVRQGVDSNKALSVGLATGTGLGVGIWAPIFGSTFLTRAFVAGAGVNVAQGIVMKAAAQQILKGEKAAEQYDPWELEGLVIDALMGIAFGSLAHAGARAREMRGTMDQTDRDALLVAQQARHLEDVTLPGRPADATALTAHVDAVRKAADDLLAGRPVNIEQIVQDARFEPDAPRAALATEIHDAVVAQARQTVLDAAAAEQARVAATDTPGFLRTADDLVALKAAEVRELAPELQRAVEIAKKPGALRTAEERIFLKDALEGRAFDALTKPIEPLVRDLPPVEPVRATTEPGKTAAEAALPDPLLTEAQQRIAVHGDIDVPLGVDEKGKPVTRKVSDLMAENAKAVEQARADADLFQVAAACLIGGA